MDDLDVGWPEITFDRKGRPISYREYAELRDEPSGYFRIAEDTLVNAWVSTVWLGISHSPFSPPIIFETMVFGGLLDGQTWRYYTEDEARRAHRHIKRLVRDVAREQRRRRYKHL